MTSEIAIWLDGAPVIPSGPEREFAIWLDGAPVLDPESDDNPYGARRRVAMF